MVLKDYGCYGVDKCLKELHEGPGDADGRELEDDEYHLAIVDSEKGWRGEEKVHMGRVDGKKLKV